MKRRLSGDGLNYSPDTSAEAEHGIVQLLSCAVILLLPARVVKLVDTRDLSAIEHPASGNGRREWSQIRGNLSTARSARSVVAIPS